MLPGGPPPAARRHTLVDDRRGESALGSTARVPCSGPSLRSLQTIPRALRLNAPPVWLEAEGARRSAATIGSMTAAATASSSENSISSPSPRAARAGPRPLTAPPLGARATARSRPAGSDEARQRPGRARDDDHADRERRHEKRPEH